MVIDSRNLDKKISMIVCKFCNKNLNSGFKVCHKCFERKRPSICFYQVAGVIASTLFVSMCVIWLTAIIFNSKNSLQLQGRPLSFATPNIKPNNIK